MDSSTYLYDVPPYLIEKLCRIIDTGDDSFGWRGLAVRIVPSWLEVRRTERVEATGKSPTRELIWSWAQQRTTVADLIRVLEDMGHYRALQLFLPQGSNTIPSDGLSQPVGHISQPELFKPTTTDKEVPQPEQIPSSPALIQGVKQRHTITYSDVIEGTRDFHPDVKIAEGLFSDMYRGQRGNETFAVKLFKQVKKDSWKKHWDLFRREMEVHHLYQHPNILQLLGCFSDEGRYCLVYPYLPNGSLSRRLHNQGAECPLSWQERLDIIKGTAKAVHHLHTAQPCPVICGSISSPNILLDERLQPKLSDFGMARLRPHSANQSCTITLDTGSYSNLGYLPEEYIRNGKLSFSLDVYSLGMVIMETITGRQVIEETPKRTLLRDVLTAEVEDSGSVDSCLRFLDQSAGSWPHSVSLCLLRLALESTASHHRSRPNMEAVLQELSQLLPLPSCPPNDQPRTLDDRALPYAGAGPSPSIAVENDEKQGYPPAQTPAPAAEAMVGPCEYSQSEVTFLSSGAEPHVSDEPPSQSSQEAAVPSLQAQEEALDLYSSWPVQCSCPAEADGLGCEDCQANGFTPYQSDIAHGDISLPSQNIVDNPAKQRLRNNLELYNKGLIKTEELFSMTQ